MQRTIASTAGRVDESIVCSDKGVLLTKENIERRNTIFTELFEKQNKMLEAETKHPIKITLPDGKVLEGTSL